MKGGTPEAGSGMMEWEGRGSMKALIVDDDDSIVEVIRDAVHWDRLGIGEVRTAYNAAAARKILAEEPVDLIISDIEMPQESGLDLLSWFQARGQDGKFILLTAHESFAYVRQAMQLQAADYLLKPFQVDAMELVLQKNIARLEKERSARSRENAGQWLLDHVPELRHVFFESLISGRILGSSEGIRANLRARNLDIPPDSRYRLCAVRVTGCEQDVAQYGGDSVRYMVGNLLGETLTEIPQQERVILRESDDQQILYLVICDPMDDRALAEKYRRFAGRCGEMLEATLTCCAGPETGLAEFSRMADALSREVRSGVSWYGQFFLSAGEAPREGETGSILDIRTMKAQLEGRKQRDLMETLKREIETRLRTRTLDSRALRVIRSEYQQGIYAFLSANGVLVSALLEDQALMDAMEKAERSPMDLLRWANMLTAKAFAASEEAQRAQSLPEQIDAYIREHYAERIGRAEIGEAFHMVPEYLAKIYKKKTGRTLKDAVNEVRIGRARLLLEQTDRKIIDIALETGFDNVPYFSTLFKKMTGFSPADWRKRSLDSPAG